jgi:hypothetical protein
MMRKRPAEVPKKEISGEHRFNIPVGGIDDVATLDEDEL